MKILIAIESCQMHRHTHAWHRDTWMRQASGEAAINFFMGADYETDDAHVSLTGTDEIFLAVADDYVSLPFKTQAICRWALKRGYDYLFKMDTDTFVHPARLLDSNFAACDYSGYFIGQEKDSYASGGSGYWLSARAMQIVVDAEFICDTIDPVRGSKYGEDLQVGKCLYAAGIQCHCDPRYRVMIPGPHPNNQVITLHDVLFPIRSEHRFRMLYEGLQGRR